MLGKEETKELKQEFWGQLNKKFNQKKNPEGSKVPWMNYKTRINHLYFRIEEDEEGFRLCIDLQFKDPAIREVYYEQFQEFSDNLNKRLDNLKWQKEFQHWNGRTISRISAELEGVSLKNRDDWSNIHDFLLKNFVELDRFWFEFGDVFKALK